MDGANQVRQDTFDFSPTIEKLRIIFDSEHPDYIPNHPHPGACLLEMHQFGEFAVFYFSNPDVWDEVIDSTLLSTTSIKKKNQLPPSRIQSFMNYEEFLSANFPERNKSISNHITPNIGIFCSVILPNHPLRTADIYPLTQSETELSVDFILKNSHFYLAMLGIKYCLVNYFDDLNSQLRRKHGVEFYYHYKNEPGVIGKFKNAFQKLRANAMDFSITQDFTPLIANGIRNLDNPWETKSLGSAMKEAFHREAFKSATEKGKYSVCPFSKSLINCLSIGFDSVTGQPIPHHGHGALILWVMDKVQKEYLSQKPADHITQHFTL
jgi:hypothetical protein